MIKKLEIIEETFHCVVEYKDDLAPQYDEIVKLVKDILK